QERAGLATELFGTRMARQLLPALEDGALSIEDAKKKAQELGIVMSEDQIQASVKFQDSMDSAKRALGAVGREIGLAVLPYLQKFLDWVLANMPQIQSKIENAFEAVASKVSELIKWFSGLDPPVKKMVGLFSGLAVAIGTISIALGTIMKVFGPYTTVIGKAITKVGKMGGLLPILKKVFVGLTNPIGIVITVLSALTLGFVTAYNKSETFRNVVNRLKDAFLNAVSGIKEFLTTNPQIQAFLNGMKTGFQTMKTHVSNAIGTVVSFFKEKIAQMKAFWDSNGTQILQAFRNVFNSIKTVVSPVMNFLMAIFRKTFPILKTILGGAFKAILAIAKSVWGNIKGVVNGGLQFIQGLIKTFSGLFTGDFSKMWEGIKDIFKGAIKFLWNFIQLSLFGKLLKGAKAFASPFKNIFSRVWNGIKNIFNKVVTWITTFVKKMFNGMKNTVSSINNGIKNVINKVWNAISSFFNKIVSKIVNFVKKRFNIMREFVSSITTKIKNVISKIWNQIYSFFSKIISKIVNFVKKRFNNMKSTISNITNNIKSLLSKIWNSIKNTISNLVTSIFNKVKSIWNNLFNTTKSIFNKVFNTAKNIFSNIKSNVTNAVKNTFDGVKNAWNNIKKKTSEVFSKVFDNIKSTFTDIVDAAKKLPGRIGDGIGNMASKVMSGVKKVTNKLAETLGKGVNGVIGGVNWVLGKIGVKSKVPEWDVPKFAKGTKGAGHKGGLMWVGEGKGSNKGSELISTPDGNHYLSPDKPTLTYGEKGTHVLSAKNTRNLFDSIPKYEDGTYDYQIGGAVSQGSNVNEMKKAKAPNVWDYITKPKLLLNKALDYLGFKM